MMNTQNLGSKESVGVNYKDDICAELWLKLWFEGDWHFCNITESGWSTVQKKSSKQLLSKVSSGAFFKVGVLKNFATVKHFVGVSF